MPGQLLPMLQGMHSATPMDPRFEYRAPRYGQIPAGGAPLANLMRAQGLGDPSQQRVLQRYGMGQNPARGPGVLDELRRHVRPPVIDPGNDPAMGNQFRIQDYLMGLGS